MSSGLPTLNRLRKPELLEIAERTNLTEYVDVVYYSIASVAHARNLEIRMKRSSTFCFYPLILTCANHLIFCLVVSPI
jgi:hypothetical protein